MSSPFEVNQRIAFYLDKKDKLTCLTLCKNWYRAIFESLYNNVEIKTLVSFRSFLLTITHHHLAPNAHVKRLFLNFDEHEKINVFERSMTFTEFELLARFCNNLIELRFKDMRYWQFFPELDLSNLWLRLKKVPHSAGHGDSFGACLTMADRLTDIDLRGYFQYSKAAELLCFLPHLKTIRIELYGIKIDWDSMKQIIDSHPDLEDLKLESTLSTGDSISNNDTVHYTLENKLKSFHCIIDHPDSNWFNVINTCLREIDCLSVRVMNKTSFYNEATRLKELLLDIIASIANTIKSTSIQQLKSNFSNIVGLDIAEMFIIEIIYAYSISKKIQDSRISMDLTYFDLYDEPMLGYRKSITLESNSCLQFLQGHMHTRHEFSIKTGISHGYKLREMDILLSIIAKPLRDQVVQLSLTSRINYMTLLNKKQPLFLDMILEHFPVLESLTFAVEKIKNNIEEDVDHVRLTLASKKQASIQDYSAVQQRHSSLRSLTIRNVRVSKRIYMYLLTSCPNLSKLSLDGVDLDDETLLALEILCLKHKVILSTCCI